MKLSSNGLNLIKKYEGCRLYAYKPVSAETYWTIGWGHYGADVYEGMKITQEQADRLLEQDMVKFESYVNSICAHLKLNQNQFDALVSFTYNCGVGNLQRLTRNRNKEQIAEHIEAYVNGASGKLPGLVRRRKEEKELYLTPIKEEKDMNEQYGYEVYDTVEEVPEWGRPSIQKAIDVGVLKGTGNGLRLTLTEVKMIVWLDRCKCLDFCD